ncbi:MAG TPA: hypothetical protein VFN48_08110 [Solirubrobacteraceae bacterium]|nr:hypothetical protein [Solirubrobacteraceae bacterium]
MTRTWLSIARSVYGVAVLAFGTRLSSEAEGREADWELRAFVTALGLRHLAQALLMQRLSQRRALKVGAGIDAVHSLSMATVFASVSRRWRWAAVADAFAAGGWATLQIRALRSLSMFSG